MSVALLPANLRVAVMSLFSQPNLCFATHSAGRTPTFYFADQGNLQNGAPCGRLRTMHPHGPLIDITTTTKRHFFFANAAGQRFAKNAFAIARSQGAGIPALNNASNVPAQGNFHFEVTMRANGSFHRRHASGGQVQLAPLPTTAQIRRILDRMCASGCAVKLDGHLQFRLVGVAPPGGPPVGGYAAYIAAI